MGVLSLRIGLGFVAIIAAVEVLQMQAVLDALLLFGAAGIVPGTTIELSPDATLWSLGGILALSILLIFHKDIIVALMPASSLELPALPTLDEPKTVVKKPGFRSTLPQITRPVFPQAGLRIRMPAARHKLEAHYQALQQFMQRAQRILRPKLLAAKARAEVAARWTWAELGKHSTQTAGYIQRFDMWATAKIERYDALAELQKLLREATKVLTDWLAKARLVIKNFLDK